MQMGKYHPESERAPCRTGQRQCEYPIRDVERRRHVVVSDEAVKYRGFAEKPRGYRADASDVVVRLGDRMAGKAGSYRLASRDAVLNFRKKKHVEDRIFRFKNAYPDIEGELMGISRREVIPDYRRPEPTE